ncbi:hypothetical protein U9M48_008476 [Paspalum notatum var. saurae]|uniref:Uncharacterized protein n=1 Tax=Paspalum notatum var. saurae TaxID=547442 RepID=A0AAQ3WDQ2_PASNO
MTDPAAPATPPLGAPRTPPPRRNTGRLRQIQGLGSSGSSARLQGHPSKQEKYKDVESSAIDLFKEMHCNKKEGFSENVQKAIVDTEAMVAAPVEDGQQPKSCAKFVSHVLPNSSLFLHSARHMHLRRPMIIRRSG